MTVECVSRLRAFDMRANVKHLCAWFSETDVSQDRMRLGMRVLSFERRIEEVDGWVMCDRKGAARQRT